MPSSSDAGRPRATVAGAFVEGWRRALTAPMLTLGVLAATFLLALPLAFTVRGMLAEHLGPSLEAEAAAVGWNAGWAAEFQAGAQGLGRTFSHEILGFGGTLAILSRFVDAQALNPTLAGAVAAYLLLWVFLIGGILDRLARARPIRATAFFSACGTWFVRFLRLYVIVGAAYGAIFVWLHPWLFGTLWTRWTRDLTAETDAVLIRAGLYAVLLGALAAVNLIADFARVRAVVEDRRSMVAALFASVRFIRRRPVRVLGLYLVNTVALGLIVAAWFVAAPAASAPVAVALLVTQVYLLFRVWARLAFMASEIAFFQGELAHAGYTAAPLPVWPDSPAAEAIDNLAAREARG